VREDWTLMLLMEAIVELEQRRFCLRWERCHRVDLRTPWWASRSRLCAGPVMRNPPLTEVASGFGRQERRTPGSRSCQFSLLICGGSDTQVLHAD
jgi:hypothetical protein